MEYLEEDIEEEEIELKARTKLMAEIDEHQRNPQSGPNAKAIR